MAKLPLEPRLSDSSPFFNHNTILILNWLSKGDIGENGLRRCGDFLEIRHVFSDDRVKGTGITLKT